MNQEQIADSDHRPILEEIRKAGGEDAVVLAIKAQMGSILRHCIECDWGACYNTKFDELVSPYLDDVNLLDEILKSEIIRETSDVIIGRTGARIFPEFIRKLSKCRNPGIRDYLSTEFAIYRLVS